MKICVFCPSNSGNDGAYVQQANRLAELLAERGHVLVYGGASRGIMGHLGTTMLESKGTVIGIMPKFAVDIEVPLQGLSELVLVDTLEDRINEMIRTSDAFLVFPGGFGTLAEMFQVITLSAYGIHKKPVGVLNIFGYYDYLLKMVDNGLSIGFISQKRMNIITVEKDAASLLDSMESMVHAVGGA